MHKTSLLNYFTKEELVPLDRQQIPSHIAIIPDGNRRWAKKESLNILTGHSAGGNNFIDTVKAAKELGIKALTLYLFSTENWSRDPLEVKALLWVIEQFLITNRKTLIEEGCRLTTIGAIEGLPKGILKILEETKEATASCNKIDVIAALNYGGRDEIKRAFKKMLHDYDQKKITGEDVTESLISSYLDTKAWQDPDLLIRTSGEMRISNFLLWQVSYAEIFFTPVLWPDFRPKDLLEAVIYYQNRIRRRGGGQ